VEELIANPEALLTVEERSVAGAPPLTTPNS
jgi:hypothetical protein